LLQKQLVKFILIGVIGTLCDWCVYVSALEYLGVISSKALAFIVGSMIAFAFNKSWTFKDKNQKKKQIPKFFILYLGTLSLNTGVNAWVLSTFEVEKIVAFVLATGLHTVVNFLGQKFWVFKQKN
jgi:putative flippase GtrA